MPVARQSLQAGTGAAERLEAADRALRLVLGQHLRHPEFGREFRQVEERRLRVLRRRPRSSAAIWSGEWLA